MHSVLSFCVLSDITTGVQDLASECLYVLGLEQVLRSKMLVSACSAVNLPVCSTGET